MIMKKSYAFGFALLVSFMISAVCHAQTESDTKDEEKVVKGVVEVTGALTKTKDSIELSAEIAGVLRDLTVNEGTTITLGQKLGSLKDDKQKLAVEKAKYELELARKKWSSDISVRLTNKAAAVAAEEYQRAVMANKEIANTYAASEVDRRKLVHEKSLLEIEQAEYELDIRGMEAQVAGNNLAQAELELQRFQILSPVNGLVTRVNRHPGEWVEPGTTILEVVDMDHFRVEGFVTVDEASLGLMDKVAEVKIPLGNKLMIKKGRVAFASPEANPVNMQVRVVLEFPFDSKEERLAFRSTLKCQVTIQKD